MIGQEEVGGAESLGEELQGKKQKKERKGKGEPERLQGEKLGAWRNHKLYGIK